MTQHCYLVVGQAFRDAFEGLQIGASVLKTTETIDGRVVVSLNAVNEFPECFNGINQADVQAVWLSTEDFPVPANYSTINL